MRDDVVALYVDPRGPYPKLVREWYDETRDARTYAGPLPVVAHPPCGPWGRLRHLSRHDDPALAPRAVEQVRTWGGVLEHPAWSKLWEHCGLPLPGELPDAFGGVCVAVDQVDFGHVARKRTWLYVVGVRGARIDWPGPGEPSHYVGCDTFWRKRALAEGRPLLKGCSAQKRRRTPVAFAEWLLDLAASARPVLAAESVGVGRG